MAEKNYILTPSPRYIPPGVRINIIFGGPLSLFGWIFFGFGLVFVWLFTLNSDFSPITELGKTVHHAKGTVTEIVKTSASEGGGKHTKGTPIYENHFTFTVDDTEYEGVSYTVGSRNSVGQNVSIEYTTPSKACIKGQRRAVFGMFPGLLVLLFPGIGLGILLHDLKKAKKAMTLLEYGNLELARLVKKEPTNTKINKQTVYKMIFEFSAADGRQYTTEARSHMPENLTDDEHERVLYDIYDPSYAIMFDNLPGNPEIDSTGNFREKGIGFTLSVLAIPLLTIIGHSIFIIYKLL